MLFTQHEMLYYIKGYLSVCLPRAFLIEVLSQDTCQGPAEYIRISSPLPERQLVCLVQIAEDSSDIITSTTPHSWVIDTIKEALIEVTSNTVDVTECTTKCEDCLRSWEQYH